MIPPFSGLYGSNQVLDTYLANDLVVLQHAPGNVHTVIVPVGPRHVLVDIGVNARHIESGWLPSLPTNGRCGGVTRGATE